METVREQTAEDTTLKRVKGKKMKEYKHKFKTVWIISKGGPGKWVVIN